MATNNGDVVHEFQKASKDEPHDIDQFTLRELIDTDSRLAQKDDEADYRIAIRKRINELEDEHAARQVRTYYSKARTWNYVWGIAAALVAIGLLAIFWPLSGGFFGALPP